MIKIFLVEDHPLVIEGIKSLLNEEDDLQCTGVCTTGQDLMQLLTKDLPDVILMDINLPDTNGIELCKQVKTKYDSVNIVALTINNQSGIIKKMIENGASGYVLKDASKNEIIEAIHLAASGKIFYSRSAATAMRQPDNKLPTLTRREKEILELIADGLTNQQIADKLFIDISTVISHRKNMMAKYSTSNTAALVKLAMQEKLI